MGGNCVVGVNLINIILGGTRSYWEGLGAIGTCSDVRLYALSNRKIPADDFITSPSRVWNDTILDRDR